MAPPFTHPGGVIYYPYVGRLYMKNSSGIGLRSLKLVTLDMLDFKIDRRGPKPGVLHLAPLRGVHPIFALLGGPR
jgi:hypothetical protein